MSKPLNDQYRDRGMLKWGGFFLSEHTAVQDEYEEEKQQSQPQKPQMEPAEIHAILQKAVQKNKKIAVQLDIVDSEGRYLADVVGMVKGADSLGLVIGEQKVAFEEIRHIEFFEDKKWSAF